MVATVIAGETRRDGASIEERALRGVGGLAQLGIGEGDVVAIMLRNEPAFLEAMLIARQAGCYSCPINWHYKADEAGYILRDCGAKALIIHADLLRQIDGGVPPGCHVIVIAPSAETRAAFRLAAEQCAIPAGATEYESWLADSPAYDGPARKVHGSLPYSSGTTGRPKGVMRQPAAPEQLARMIEITQTALGIRPGMRTAIVAPLYHSAPASYGMQSLMFGELVLMHERFDAERLLADIERHKLDRLYLVPTHFVRLLRLPDAVKRRYDLSSVAVRRQHRLALPARGEEADDRLVGAGDQRKLCEQRSRVHHAAVVGGIAHPSGLGRPAAAGADVRIMDDAARYCRRSSRG